MAEDTHWNPSNMIYGDSPDKDNPGPDMSAIMQSRNLYLYCMNNPITRFDPSGLISWQEASDIIRRNAQGIKNAGAYYGVNPAIIAGCIYTELTWNYSWVDDATDVSGYWLDTSIGIGQVKVSTARNLEDKGYIAKTKYKRQENSWGNIQIVWETPGYNNNETHADNRDQAIAYRLTSESENINYVAAYLAYIQDIWKGVYPQIDGKSDILGTLYNIGEYGSRGPNSNPNATPFGENVKKEYYYMRDLLGL